MMPKWLVYIYALTVVLSLAWVGWCAWLVLPAYLLARQLGGFTRLEDYVVFVPFLAGAVYGLAGIVVLVKRANRWQGGVK